MGAWAAAGVGIHWDGPRYLVLAVMALGRDRRGRGVDPRAGAGPGPLAGQRDHHHAAVELRRRPVGRLVQLRHLAGPGRRGRAVDAGRARPDCRSSPDRTRCTSASSSRSIIAAAIVRRVPVDAVGLRGRHDRRQPPRSRVRRDPRDPAHRRRDADLRRHRRAVGHAPPCRAGPAAQLLDLQQLRAVRLHRRRPRRELRRRRRRRVGLHRRDCCTPGSRCRPTGCRCSSSPPCTASCCSASPSARSRPATASCDAAPARAGGGAPMSLLGDILETALPASTSVALAASGEMLNERAGTLNLGQEGLLSLGAVAAFIVGTNVRNPFLALGVGMLVGAVAGVVFATAAVVRPRQPGAGRPRARRRRCRAGQPARQRPPGRPPDQPLRAGRDPRS